ncbi:FIG00927397: hypothetical protein [hydrothermal vent metagenome]|uniref:ASCH domain-containing protein n=1 Tax=hydrothermal vent metagenome TaxID=652676 RepID=A0A3B1E2I8_9ZZZZ
MTSPDINRITLSIQQPWAELILRGIKTLEVRSQNTNVRGLIYLYTSKKLATSKEAIAAASQYDINTDALPTGMVVGTVELFDVTLAKKKHAKEACLSRTSFKENVHYVWHLKNPDHFVDPIKAKYVPYGVWFYPFQRKKN